MIAREQLPLALGVREAERHDGRAEEDGDDPGQVRPLISLQEGRLRGLVVICCA